MRKTIVALSAAGLMVLGTAGAAQSDDGGTPMQQGPCKVKIYCPIPN